jgi:hypothetical protein
MKRIAGGITAAMKIASPQIYAQIVRIPDTPLVPDIMTTAGLANSLMPLNTHQILKHIL